MHEATLMSPTSPILQQYERIAELSGQMLELARANEWDAVVSLSRDYAQAVENLKALQPLNDEDLLARKPLLARILQDDASIRHLASPELARLGTLLGNMRRHQNVLETYLAPSKNRP